MHKRDIKVMIVDDQTLFRSGLIALLNDSGGIEVVGEAANGAQAVEIAPTLMPDVILMNIMMPIMDGITAARRIKQAISNIEILFLSSSYQESKVKEGFECGAKGFLQKDCEIKELLFAVHKAAYGDYYISGRIGPDVISAYINTHIQTQRPGGLMTQREREMAKLLADGYSTKEAAAILNISPKTAETHRASIMKKLKAKNVTDIVKYCIRNQIIEA
ncbi:MAG: response regulator transcription factor [bacterium]|nr:response regulator transcription factor [bacterium]